MQKAPPTDPNNAYQLYLQQQRFSSNWNQQTYQQLLDQQQAARKVHEQMSHVAQQQQLAPAPPQQPPIQMGSLGQMNLEYGNQQGQLPRQQPSKIEFHKLEPEQFREYTLYYRSTCPHSINLLARLAKDPLLDSRLNRVDVDRYQVTGLIGVPTIVDQQKQVFLGDDALRWVVSKASNHIVGMDVEDVAGAPTSDLAPLDSGGNFSFVHESLLNMPQVNSLQQVKTRQEQGPLVDSALKVAESQRQQFIQPYADPGNLKPPPPTADRTSVAQSQLRPTMNPSHKQAKNSGYEMSRAALMGDTRQHRRYE